MAIPDLASGAWPHLNIGREVGFLPGSASQQLLVVHIPIQGKHDEAQQHGLASLAGWRITVTCGLRRVGEGAGRWGEGVRVRG